MIQPHIKELIEMSKDAKRVRVSAPTIEEIEENLRKVLEDARKIPNDSK